MNLLARDALTPKGGLSPMIFSQSNTNKKGDASADGFGDTSI